MGCAVVCVYIMGRREEKSPFSVGAEDEGAGAGRTSRTVCAANGPLFLPVCTWFQQAINAASCGSCWP